jgi:curved DNA-binding protein CbpA
MENLYAFLNIESTSTEAEIYLAYIEKSAYLEENIHVLPDEQEKQLALLQKVHDILLNPEQRKNYDEIYISRQRKLNSMLYLVSDEKPIILHFDTNKRQYKIGDEVIVTWKTTGCDQVILLPFGPVLNLGQKTFAIKTEEDLNMQFELIATNTVNGSMKKACIPPKFEKIKNEITRLDEDPVYAERYQQYLKREENKKNAAMEDNTCNDGCESKEKKKELGIIDKLKRIVRSIFE